MSDKFCRLTFFKVRSNYHSTSEKLLQFKSTCKEHAKWSIILVCESTPATTPPPSLPPPPPSLHTPPYFLLRVDDLSTWPAHGGFTRLHRPSHVLHSTVHNSNISDVRRISSQLPEFWDLSRREKARRYNREPADGRVPGTGVHTPSSSIVHDSLMHTTSGTGKK